MAHFAKTLADAKKSNPGTKRQIEFIQNNDRDTRQGMFITVWRISGSWSNKYSGLVAAGVGNSCGELPDAIIVCTCTVAHPPCNITDAIVLLLLSASSSSASRRFLLRYLIMRKRTTSDKSAQLWQMLWKGWASLASGVHCFVQRCSYCLVVFCNY